MLDETSLDSMRRDGGTAYTDLAAAAVSGAQKQPVPTQVWVLEATAVVSQPSAGLAQGCLCLPCTLLWTLRLLPASVATEEILNNRQRKWGAERGQDLIWSSCIPSTFVKPKEKPITLFLLSPYRAHVFQQEALLVCRESGCRKDGRSELSCTQLSIRTRTGHSLIFSLGLESVQSGTLGRIWMKDRL